MTKSLLIALLITTIPLVGYTQQSTFRDQYGNVVGYSDRNGDTTKYRDQYNNDVGFSRDNQDGRKDYYDEYGNDVGSRTKDE
jgi:hypothetical protein